MQYKLKIVFICVSFVLQDSIRKCPICNDIFPDDIETRDYEAHVQSHLLECPVCNEAFEKSNQQVFDDHMLCHSLE